MFSAGIGFGSGHREQGCDERQVSQGPVGRITPGGAVLNHREPEISIAAHDFDARLEMHRQDLSNPRPGAGDVPCRRIDPSSGLAKPQGGRGIEARENPYRV
jgi:hypothetical protein